ncbi:MAG: hypothetical protein HN348_19765 [Proteobacteria bacterium]|jgi:zinc D-Ala-D-Ala dipeptidase|nr:hypothetical protein [Pseudomonadota bacterium]
MKLSFIELTLAFVLACGSPEKPQISKNEVLDATTEAPRAEPEAATPEEVIPPDLSRHPPEGWSDVATISGIRLDIRYHSANNFTGAPLPGYGVPRAWLLDEPDAALAKVQEELEAQNLGLIVYDAYRPLRGTKGMVAWAERTNQTHLLDNGYIARRSGHNKGNTIDLSVVDLESGQPLDMGNAFDTLDATSHTKNAEGEALDNRMLLKTAMEHHGWKNYWKEWWHFSFAMEEKLRHRDVPYSCFEPDEGSYQPPPNWNQPDFVMPASWPEVAECNNEIMANPE